MSPKHLQQTHITTPLNDQRTFILVLGPPGAGKTTTTLLLTRIMNAEAIVASRVLQTYRDVVHDPDCRDTILTAIASGHQYDDSRFYKYILDAADQSSRSITLIDGFPRTPLGAAIIKQRYSLLAATAQFLVLHIHAPADVCQSRYLSKSPANSNNAFNVRMKHYVSIEREVMRDLAALIPLIDVDTSTNV